VVHPFAPEVKKSYDSIWWLSIGKTVNFERIKNKAVAIDI
jgi:hypothetical protein